MTERVVWTCDGCGDEQERRENQTSDWKRYTATLDNARGYPLCRTDDIISIEAHLCPSCASTLASKINPRTWPHVAPSNRPPVDAAA